MNLAIFQFLSRRKMRLVFGRGLNLSSTAESTNRFSPLELEPFYGTFIVVGSLLAVAVMIFIGEIMKGNRKDI